MGNAQSAPQHNRLVKPKTNSNSPFSSPTVPFPASESTKYSDPLVDIILSPTGDSRSRLDTGDQLRAKVTSPTDGSFSQGSDEDDSLGELANHVRDRLQSLSRSNSVASQLPSAHASTTKLSSLEGSKLSLLPDSRSVDIESAISILQELRKNASPDDLVALREALQPSRPTESPSISASCPSPRKPAAGKPSQSLIRRRSMATPGLATRGSPTDVLRKPVEHMEAQIDKREDQEWQVDRMIGYSPLTRLASLDLTPERRVSSIPRAQTPGEMAYSHLGGLKLGSLTITNGAASPAPSVRSKMIDRRKSTPDHLQEEDYFTASEGPPSPTASMQHRVNRMHLRSQSSVLPAPSPLSRDSRQPSRVQKALPAPLRSGSPLKREAVCNGSKRNIPQKEAVRTNGPVKNKSAPSIAQEYMDELATSPFASQEEFTERFNEPRDSIDETRSDGNPDDGWSYREEAYRMLSGTTFADSDAQTGLPSSIPQQKTPVYRRPSHSKADSGYSSGASLRALEHDVRGEEASIPSLPNNASVLADGKSQQSGHGTEDSQSLYTFEQMLSLSNAEKPLPSTPDKQDVKAKPTRLSLLPTKSWRGSLTTTIPTVSAPPTPSSIVSSENVDSKKAAMSKRLQKRRPSSHTIPLVHTCEPVKEGTIPTIPDNVRAHFTRRLSEAPGMDHLTHTFASASSENPDEDIAEHKGVSVPIRFPSPAVDEPRKKKHHHRSQSARPPTPSPHRHRRSLSIFRSAKSSGDKDVHCEPDELLGVADFGTVAQSLGSSPYDIAALALKKPPVTSPTHPHQLGTPHLRAKSMVSMDSTTASDFARMRSRERVAPGPDIHRPRSYHDYNLEAGEATVARQLSSHGSRTAVPPVPQLDSKRMSQVRLSALRNDNNPNVQPSDQAMVRPKIVNRETSVSALIEKFNESRTEASPDWAASSRLWRQRRKSIGEGLRRQHDDTAPHHSQSCKASPQVETFTDRGKWRSPHTSKPPLTHTPAKTDSGIFDRYGGGLSYGYEYGLGIGGSAGTRHMRSGASRKSMYFSNEFGIDLSDIPVFLQKAG